MDAVKKLAACEFSQEVYHSDGFGHIQVETVSTLGFDPSPLMLLDEIDQESKWPEFFVMAKTKSESWLLELVNHFPLTESYSTSCFVEMLNILSGRDALIILLQESPSWYWSDQNSSLIDTVLNKVELLINGTTADILNDEIERDMFNDISQRLIGLKLQIESPKMCEPKRGGDS